MIKNKLLRKMNNLIKSLSAEPLTMKKAVLLCCYARGMWFVAGILCSRLNLYFGLIPDIIFLGTVLIIAREMGKNELRRILVWRDIPFGVFAAVLVMSYGFEIIISELSNLFQIILPTPKNFFDGLFYEPDNVFLYIISNSLFPAFSEEIFCRGIIARRFLRVYSTRKAIVLSAVLFGVMHLNPWQAVNAFLAGIFYGWIYWRYKSIWLCMFLHASHNILVTFMPLPYNYYDEMWRHPLWFDIMGLLLFGLGLIMLSRKRENRGPNYAYAYFNRGLAYRNKGENEQAIADYTEAIRLDPNYAAAYNSRGNAYWAKGDSDRAIADYTQAIKLDPNHARAYNNRGNAYRAKGDSDRAIADYTEAIRLDPNYARAKSALYAARQMQEKLSPADRGRGE